MVLKPANKYQIIQPLYQIIYLAFDLLWSQQSVS